MSGLSLYELGSEYQRLLDLMEQAGTPEDEAMFQEALRALTGDIVEKCDRCGAVMATMDATCDAIKNEEERLRARRAAIESNRSRLAENVKRLMEEANVSKAKGPRFSLLLVDNPGKVVVDDEALFAADARFWRQKTELARDVLAAALKGGEVVPGARLERSKSLRVR